jgi:23S rRNA (pseudouridine1915-N3)-methyltransferase
MLMKIIVVGKPKDKVLGAKSADFVSRCGAYGKVECVELPDSDVAREGKALMRELEKEKNSFVFVLSEEGKLFSTAQFARKISSVDRKLVFVIGGPFGLAPEVKERADIL